jgi:hypothetical protein
MENLKAGFAGLAVEFEGGDGERLAVLRRRWRWRSGRRVSACGCKEASEAVINSMGIGALLTSKNADSAVIRCNIQIASTWRKIEPRMKFTHNISGSEGCRLFV